LALEKFFTSSFGNIFEAGILFDPEFSLGADQRWGQSLPFEVCGEEAITAVAGWDTLDASLFIEITTPGGQVIASGAAGTLQSTGRTWTFFRVTLPHAGERDGTWTCRVGRPRGGGEFPPPAPALTYFLSVVPNGGPKLTRLPDSRRYYTGDTVNPLVMVRYADGGWPRDAQVGLTLQRPDEGTGNILTRSGLRGPSTVDGDTVPARQATLLALEKELGNPVVNYLETTFDLRHDAASTGGLFEESGIYGAVLADQLTKEGHFTFHARASFGADCASTREVLWSLSVDVGIDPSRTEVTTQPLGGPDDHQIRVTITPKDKYGNHLGPGRGTDFDLTPQPGTTLTTPLADNGDGSYTVDVAWDPDVTSEPGVNVTQPGRPPVAIPTLPLPRDGRHTYSVKFLCGVQPEAECHCAPVCPGRYATEVNIHNYQGTEVRVVQRLIPLVLAGAESGRSPLHGESRASIETVLPPHSATMEDCCWIGERLLGAPAPTGQLLTLGILEIRSDQPLAVSAVYTVSDSASGPVSVDVEQIVEQR
jgi:hypothetical protein